MNINRTKNIKRNFLFILAMYLEQPAIESH